MDGVGVGFKGGVENVDGGVVLRLKIWGVGWMIFVKIIIRGFVGDFGWYLLFIIYGF